MPHRPNPANPVNPSNPYQSGPNGPIMRRPPMPRPMPQPGLMGGRPWPNQAPMAPYAPGYQRPPMPPQRGYPPPGYYGRPPQQRRRPMPIDNIGSVGSPVGNQGGIGTAAQNEAVANGFIGAALSMSPLGPLGPMAANAMLGTNFGRAPPGPLSLLQLMQNSMSSSDDGFGSITGGSGVPGAVANNPSGYVAGMENVSLGGYGGLADGFGVSTGSDGAHGSDGVGGGYGGDTATDGSAGSDGSNAAGTTGAGGGLAGATDSGSAGSGGDGTFICTELHRQGRMDDRLYAIDAAYGAALALSDPLAVRGYQRWALPVSKLMRRSKVLSTAVAAIARPWAMEMAHEMGHGKGSSIGRLMMRLGLPICRALAPSGDDHLRCVKLGITATFPKIQG